MCMWLTWKGYDFKFQIRFTRDAAFMLSKIDIERLAKRSKNVSTRIIKFDQRGHWKSPSDVGDGHF